MLEASDSAGRRLGLPGSGLLKIAAVPATLALGGVLTALCKISASPWLYIRLKEVPALPQRGQG